MDPVNLNRLAHFAAVADTGSFTKAAEQLGITKSVISQQVSRLEAELKTSLLVRTTRRVALTEAGNLLHARCKTIFGEAEAAIGEIAEINAEPAGHLRIAAPNDFGTHIIAPIMAAFIRKYTACTVELLLSDARVDLVAERIDLSVRVGWLDDSSYLARRVGTFRQLPVAAPDLAGIPNVASPEDLSGLPFIANAALKEPIAWRFTGEGSSRKSVTTRQDILTNSTPAALEAALAGGGVSVLPDFLVSEAIANGRLVHLLPSWRLPEGGVYVVYPPARFRPPKVTAFVEMLSRDQRRRATERA